MTRGRGDIYGQETNDTDHRLAFMNLGIRGIEADFGPEHTDTSRGDPYKDDNADRHSLPVAIGHHPKNLA